MTILKVMYRIYKCSCLKYLGQHLYVSSAKISSETVHRNFKLASHPNKIIPLSESLQSHHPYLLQHQYHQEYCGIRLDFWVVPGGVSFFPCTYKM